MPRYHIWTIGCQMNKADSERIAAYLERAGYRVRLVNLAVRMLKDKNFNVEAMIKRLNPLVFGIDLHWMVHCHGAIEVARLIKKHHPQARVIFGGFSSSYYYKELMEYPEIDYVLRGDSTEEPMRQLMYCIKNGAEPDTVPNLVWRNSRNGFHGKFMVRSSTANPAMLERCMVPTKIKIVAFVVFPVN